MNKNVIIIVAVILALGAGYMLSKQSSNDTPSSDASTTAKTETTGASLDLSGQQLTAFPESALRSDIKNLNLSNNQLTSLPADITKLTNLEVLNIENNRLESLPPEISQLTSLREIHANNNRMTSLPAELGDMTYLTLLDISGNNIPPDEVEQLRVKLPRAEIKN